MRLADADVPYETILLAGILDQTNIIRWLQTEDAQHGRNRPQQILPMLLKQDTEMQGFSSGEEYEKARQKLLEGLNV